ncbi:MAG: hypothetical protein P8X86_00835 [Desulfofustis sp.]|jgi:hypothetical protein
MQVSEILAHPDQASCNYAIAVTVITTLSGAAARVNFDDLCRERFEPLLFAVEILK